MPTDQELQDIIKADLGVESDAIVLTNLPLWMSLYSTYEPGIKYLYTTRRVLVYLLGKARKLVDSTIGFDNIKNQQVFENTLKLLKMNSAEIAEQDPGGGTATYLYSSSPCRQDYKLLPEETADDFIHYWNMGICA